MTHAERVAAARVLRLSRAVLELRRTLAATEQALRRASAALEAVSAPTTKAVS